jgi:hypothetical protein
MTFPKRRTLLIAALASLMITGCPENENERLLKMAERHMERQVDQNGQMAQLQQEVAQGARQLVESDSAARKELLALQRQVQTERAEIGQQRDLLEKDRRDWATQRHRDPVVAAAITHVALLIACLLPLVLCWYLLHRPAEPTDDRLVAEVLLQDLLVEAPLLLPKPEGRPSITFRACEEAHSSSDDSEEGDESS